MDARRAPLESLTALMSREEAVLGDLLRLADQMRDALITSDFALLEAAGNRMREAGELLDSLEGERESLMTSSGFEPASLEGAVALANQLGLPALESSRTRLAGIALSLEQAQERNARLVLGAVRLRERWFNILAGMISPTYGAGGRQNPSPGRRFVSKSA